MTDGNRGLGGLASAYAMAGERDKALQVAARVEKQAKQKHVDPMDLAVIYAAIGDKDRSFAQLEQALKKREPKFLPRLQENPAFESLRSDNRYADILGRAGLER